MSSDNSANWAPIVGLVSELKRCDEGGVMMASIAMAYIAIDTLAGLGRPLEKSRVTRSDFKAWVERYLQAHGSQPYQYRGKDVYAARCALLHNYGSVTSLHEEEPDTIKFTYNDGGKHYYHPATDKSVAIIGARSFVNDVLFGIEAFSQDCANDPDLRARVETRLGDVLNVMPFPDQSSGT